MSRKRWCYVFGALTICAQIVYPLMDSDGKLWATRASVITFAIGSLIHAGRPAIAAAIVLVGGGFVVELLGHRTGFPFGSYDYTETLGLAVLGVPLYVPLAWAMMGWPAFLAGRVSGRPALIGSAVLVSWDLFLDPQMVGDGHWRWEQTGWPEIHGIPVSNFLGWAFVSALMMLVLDRLVPAERGRESWASGDLVFPAIMLAWVWFSETIGFAVFFNRPEVIWPASPALLGVLAFTGWKWRRSQSSLVSS